MVLRNAIDQSVFFVFLMYGTGKWRGYSAFRRCREVIILEQFDALIDNNPNSNLTPDPNPEPEPYCHPNPTFAVREKHPRFLMSPNRV